MSLIKPKSIKESVLNHLKNGPVLTVQIVEKIKSDRPGTTKQAVYAALRELKQEEAVLTVRGTASLNITWVNQMADYFEGVRASYSQDETRGSFLRLEDKERIGYFFKDAHRADIFWTHAYFFLLEKLAPGEPVFLYNPHEWFLLARTENEKSVIASTIQSGHPFLVTTGGATILDKQVRIYFDGDMSQYNMLKMPPYKESNYYINIFGDFIIEVWLDKEVARKIEELYQTTLEWSEVIAGQFKNILESSGRMKMIISRNHKKADRLKKTLRKGFAISKNKKSGTTAGSSSS